MGIYIKGMEIPKVPTRFIIFADGRVEDEDDSAYKYSAIPVPPHGRLGDLDELLDRAFGCLDEETFLAFQFLVNGSVAIIPAEEE